MTGRTKIILVLLIGGGAGFILFRTAERTWGGRVTALVARTYQASPIRVGDIHSFRAELSLPHGSPSGNNIEVPETVYEKLAAGDSYERQLRAVPFLGIQGLEHRATRNGQVVAEWDEGYPFFYGVVGVAGIGVGILVTALVVLVLGAAGIKKAPNV